MLKAVTGCDEKKICLDCGFKRVLTVGEEPKGALMNSVRTTGVCRLLKRQRCGEGGHRVDEE